MMYTIQNANGKRYYVEASYWQGLDSVLLLADYGSKSAEEIAAGASPVKYIVARGWSERAKSWDCATYYDIRSYPALQAIEDAKVEYLDIVGSYLHRLH